MSRISQKQMHHLATNPHAYVKFRATGQLPPTVKPASPLITLLETIPPRLRQQIRGVRLSPALGYSTGMQFHTAEQLVKWLKPDQEMLAARSWPAESYRDKRFHKRLALADLQTHSASWPDSEAFRRAGLLTEQ